MWVTRLGLFLLLAFALFWLLFGISPANAGGLLLDGTSDYQTVAAQLTSIEQTQQYFDTQTAEAYWQPLISSSTPVPTNNYWCPNGLPTGWGTVTPEAWWSMNCGQCAATAIASRTITPTAFSTYFPTATRTATVTGGPTATATTYPASTLRIRTVSTIQGTVTPGGGYYSIPVPIKPEDKGKVVAVIILLRRNSGNDLYIEYDGNGTMPSIQNLLPTGQWKMFMPRALIASLNTWGFTGGWEGLDGNYTTAFINYNRYVSPFTLALYEQISGVMFTQAIVDSNIGITSVANQQNNGTFVVGLKGFANISYVIYGYVTWGQSSGTPTPVANYCGTVNNGESGGGGGGGSGSVDLGINLPEISVGPASCTTFGGWGFDWTDSPPLPAISFELPSVTLCFQPLSFGSFDLFGVAIDMNLFVTIMGAAVLLRWALRS